ncbi:MAG: signal peptidase I [Erysipelotrichaceae bacterium]|nr:signal peptidase I [Erysipelotrichaceae bacterium]
MSEYSSKEYLEEINRLKQQNSSSRITLYAACALAIIAAAIVLITIAFLPVLRIYGTSMSPTLSEGDYVIAKKGSEFAPGDIVAFYYNNKILVKRVIANEGDWVNIDDQGNVYVNNVLVEEPYLQEKAYGECNITLPYQVPEDRIFVMGDYRSASVDSRSTSVGCVADEQIIGRIISTIWPLKHFGRVK